MTRNQLPFGIDSNTVFEKVRSLNFQGGDILKSHQIELEAEATVFRSDGTIRERRIIGEPFPEGQVQMLVRDAGGETVSVKSFPMQSFLRNWVHYLDSRAARANRAFIKTDGNTYTQQLERWRLDYAVAGQVGIGTVIGTDDGSVLPLDWLNYTLGAKIAHGVGANQMSYSAQVIGSAGAVGSNIELPLTRTFTNSSGGTITVKEVGLIAYGRGYPEDNLYALSIRDLSDAGGALSVAVLNNQTLEVKYTLKTAQSSGFVLNHLFMIEAVFLYAAKNFTSTTGAVFSFNPSTQGSTTCQDYTAPLGEDEYGVVVGTNSDALDQGDTKLGAQILQGTGTGQLSYGAGENEATTLVGSDMSFAVKRTFTNNSGASISVQEAGLYSEGKNTTTSRLMMARTLVGGVIVANTESLQIRYIFKHTI